MFGQEFFHSTAFNFFVLPFLIFFSRIIDVSIDTMRLIFVSRGYKIIAASCGFFQVLVWTVAITVVMKNLTNPLLYIAYAGGFSTGNYIGMVIEEKIALGTVLIRIISKEDISVIVEYLKLKNYGVTILGAQGLFSDVKILFTILPRQDINMVVSFFKSLDPQIFYTIEDIRYVNKIITPNNKLNFIRKIFFNLQNRK